jgi:hypothetical protein
MIDRNPFKAPVSSERPCVEHVLSWSWERETIRIAKENGYQGELTKDPILKKYRFCNIRRRDDRVSKWIYDNMLYPCKGEKDVWFVSAIARYVNWPPSLQALINEDAIPLNAEDFDYDLFASVMDGITASGTKAWGGAYVLYPGHLEPGTPKGYRVGKHILKPLIQYRDEILSAIHDTNSVEATVNAISKSYGFSTFTGGQIAADLTYIPALKNAYDIYDYAPKGPGSQSGLNLLHGYPPAYEWCQSHFNEALIKIRQRIVYELDIDDMTLHDVQNVMCELRKYWKELYGTGHPKTIYRPETRF